MASFNNCSFSGNLGRDPEMRYFEDGKMLATFSIAVENRKKQTLWMNVKVWGKQAQVVADYIRKGSGVIVNGELQEETWEKDGQQKSKMVLNCQNFIMVGGKRNGNGSSDKAGSAPRPESRPRNPDPIDDEIPF